MAVRRKARELMEDCPLLDEVIIGDKVSGPFSKHLAQAARQVMSLRKAGYDLAIDFRTGTRGALMAWLSGAPRRVAFYDANETFWRNWAFTHIANIPYTKGTYVADYYHEILRAFALSNLPGPLELQVNPERMKSVAGLCREMGFDTRSPYVVLQPFSLWAYKELPLNHYVQIIEHIHRRYSLRVVVSGGPEEKDKAESMLALCKSNPLNLAGQTSIGEMAALLSKSQLFVGIDSAGLHIAAAVRCPTVGIFGPSAASSWAPRGKRHKVVQPDEPCVPCRDKGCQGTEVSRCLQQMPAEKIIEAVEMQLNVSRSEQGTE